MESEKFTSEDLSDLKNQLTVAMSRMGDPAPTDDQGWAVFFALLRFINDRDISNDIPREQINRKSPPSFEIAIPNTRYFLNVKSAALAAAAIVTDVLVTSGVVSGVLSSLGYLTPCLTALDIETGELCIFTSIVSSLKVMGAKSISISELHGCSHYAIPGCRWLRNGTCTISLQCYIEIIERMGRKGALREEFDKICIPF